MVDGAAGVGNDKLLIVSYRAQKRKGAKEEGIEGIENKLVEYTHHHPGTLLETHIMTGILP